MLLLLLLLLELLLELLLLLAAAACRCFLPLLFAAADCRRCQQCGVRRGLRRPLVHDGAADRGQAVEEREMDGRRLLYLKCSDI